MLQARLMYVCENKRILLSMAFVAMQSAVATNDLRSLGEQLRTPSHCPQGACPCGEHLEIVPALPPVCEEVQGASNGGVGPTAPENAHHLGRRCTPSEVGAAASAQSIRGWKHAPVWALHRSCQSRRMGALNAGEGFSSTAREGRPCSTDIVRWETSPGLGALPV